MDRYSVVSGVLTAGAICPWTDMAGAQAPGGLPAALFCQPHTNTLAASASNKAARRVSAYDFPFQGLSGTNGRMPVYLTSNLTTLFGRSKMEREPSLLGRLGKLLVMLRFIATGQ